MNVMVYMMYITQPFKRLGLDTRSEIHSSRGRCDVLVFTENFIYALELKLNSTADAELEQLLEKGYYGLIKVITEKK